jgi:pyruvate formate lyase activating enzyme
MRIGGFVKQSLIDYPNKIAAVVFTQGCNFQCGYCHNPQLVLPHLFIENPEFNPSNIFRYLKSRKNWLDGVVITGGEPTIHKDLPEFLKKIKAMGYSIKLDTNGSNPYMLKQIITNKLVDYIAMDIKNIPEKNLYEEITGIQMTTKIIENLQLSIQIINNSSIEREFRTTFIPKIHNKNTIELIKKLVGKNICYKVNEFREGETIEKELHSN